MSCVINSEHPTTTTVHFNRASSSGWYHPSHQLLRTILDSDWTSSHLWLGSFGRRQWSFMTIITNSSMPTMAQWWIGGIETWHILALAWLSIHKSLALIQVLLAVGRTCVTLGLLILLFSTCSEGSAWIYIYIYILSDPISPCEKQLKSYKLSKG